MRTSGAELDAGYVLARRILLDALAALALYGPDAVIVVGAQAIYLRCQDHEQIPIPPFTLDSDLVFDVARRVSHLPIRAHLESRGYSLRDGQPGLYQAPNLPPEALAAGGVDLFVPAAHAIGDHRRDANLPGDSRAARRQRGLELALIDRSRIAIRSLQPNDSRIVEALVAGPAALLVSKLVKIDERMAGDPDRIEQKDVLDVYRLLRSHDTEALVRAIKSCRGQEKAAPVIDEAIGSLRTHFTTAPARALTLLGRYLEPYPAKATVVEATRILSEELFNALAKA